MVLKALRRPGPSDDVKQRDGVNRDKVKAFRIIQIALVSSVLTYGPMVIALLLYYVLDYKTFLALRRPRPGDDIKKKDGVNRDKVKASWIIQIMLVSSVLTYTPVTITLVLYYILDFTI
ncbi:hypothetical protein ROHU_015014 [Labeo rohita]|uniref:Uncharacterized protein n=1 Tax=Labeo rohita TaxID=84645 RepID=A0A498NR29_LABRO|nr:hypothetical protein ROHU_015014 [Labeo rohita]